MNGQDKLPKCCNDVNQQINLANNLSINRNKEDGEINIDATLQKKQLQGIKSLKRIATFN